MCLLHHEHSKGKMTTFSRHSFIREIIYSPAIFVKIGESLAEAFEGSSEGFMFNTRVPMDTLYNIPSIE